MTTQRDTAMQTATVNEPGSHVLSNWIEMAKPAYDDDGNANYLDAEGELLTGIYLGVPNEVYHALPALSSSALKAFAQSPAKYYRDYLSDVERKRTLAQKRTFDAGTYGHALCLEPQGFYNRYFRDLVPSDVPDALMTIDDINTALVQAGLKASESKQDKLARLNRLEPELDISGLKTVSDINEALEKAGHSKSESKLDKAYRLLGVCPDAMVFEFLFTENRTKHGTEAREVCPEHGDVTVFGNKIPIDGVVWDDAHRVQTTVRSHAEADLYISNGAPEVTMIARCPISGGFVKVKFDWLRFDDEAVDLKTTLSASATEFARQIDKLGYDLQEAFYTYVASLAGVNLKDFYFVAAEYVNADICQPYRLSDKRKSKASLRMQSALTDYKECVATNRWFGYQKEDCTIELF